MALWEVFHADSCLVSLDDPTQSADSIGTALGWSSEIYRDHPVNLTS